MFSVYSSPKVCVKRGKSIVCYLFIVGCYHVSVSILITMPINFFVEHPAFFKGFTGSSTKA